MWHFWRRFLSVVGFECGHAPLAPPCPSFQSARLEPAQFAAMMRFSLGDFYADVAAYGRKDFVCEVYTDGGDTPLIVAQAGDLKEALQLACRHLETAKNTELIWAAQGRKGPAVAKSEEFLREAFETLSQFSEEMEP